jgi:RNA polymerase sigma-70 factor (ECF subfamily)
MSGSEFNAGPSGAPADFATTHWSVVLRAGRDDQSQLAALEELCKNYWRPIYAYVRRRGSTPEEAQDLTQSFFEKLLEKNWLADVDPQRARFRSFLLTMVSRFIVNEYHRTHTQKRGGKAFHFSVQDPELENQLVASPSAGSPEQDFDRHWAMTLLDRALKRLRAEAEESGKAAQFDLLSPHLSQEAEAGDYARLATQLKMSSGAVAVSVHRLRHRYRELVRAEIAETLTDQADTDLEMNHLMAALR